MQLQDKDILVLHSWQPLLNDQLIAFQSVVDLIVETSKNDVVITSQQGFQKLLIRFS